MIESALRFFHHVWVIAAFAVIFQIGMGQSMAAPIDELPPSPPALDSSSPDPTTLCAGVPLTKPNGLDAIALAAYAHCAQALALASCREGGDAGVVKQLATRLVLPELRLIKGLRRLNSERRSSNNWCDVTLAHYAAIIDYAAAAPTDLAEQREDWIRYTLGDENGIIAPGGLSRALEQRRTLVRDSTASGRNLAHRLQSSGAQSPGALPSNPGGWTNLSGYVHPVGRINDLLIHPSFPDTMWAGSDGGGIWKTSDGGGSWQPVDDFLGSLSVASFAMRAGDPNTIYVATGAQGSHGGAIGAGVFKSVDGGTTWAQLPSTDPAKIGDWSSTYKLAIHPADSNIVLAATAGGAYLTNDGGVSWTKLYTGIARSVAIHPSNGNLRVIAMDDGTVRVSTNGTNYVGSTIAATAVSSYTRITLSPSNPSVMYALVNNANNTELYRSANGGASWSRVTPPANFFYNGALLRFTGAIWVDPKNENHIAVAEGWAMVTADASVATPVWKQAAAGWTDFHSIVSHPGYDGAFNKVVYFMDDGGLYKWTDVDSIDKGQPAFLATNGMTVTQVYSVAGRGGNVILGAQDVSSRVYRSDANATRWFLMKNAATGYPINGDGAAVAADPSNPNILYGSRQFLNLWRSTDGGITATAICSPSLTDVDCTSPHFPATGKTTFIAPMVLDPNHPNRMLAGGRSLWRSDDVSTGTPPNWSAISTGLKGSSIFNIAVAPSDSNVIWIVYGTGEIYKTTNGTNTSPVWTPVEYHRYQPSWPSGNITSIHIDRTDSKRVYLGFSGYSEGYPGPRMSVTSDGGITWAAIQGLPGTSIFAIAQHPTIPQWLYAGTAVGLFASEDNGVTWSTSNYGPANVQVRDLYWYSESGTSAELLVATFGRGVWRASLNPSASAGVIGFQSGNYTVSENAVGGAQLHLVRSAGSAGAVSVNYSTVDGTATAGTDYTPVVNGTVSWADGDLSVKTLSIPVANDGKIEPDESFRVVLSSPSSGASLGTLSSATVTIKDPDQFPAACQPPVGWYVPPTANAGWVVANDQVVEGTCSLKSAPIQDGQVAEIAYTGDFLAGTISFMGKVSTAYPCGIFKFVLDDYEWFVFSGEYDWSFRPSGYQFGVKAGTHTLRFSYEKKPGCGVTGGDAAWIDALVLPLVPSAASTLNLAPKWNLVGNSSSGAFDVATLLGDGAKVNSVWKWVSASAKWAFYAPSLSAQALTEYANTKGYDVLATINGGEGFWVNAITAFAVQVPAGSAIGSTPLGAAVSGWNLIAIGDSKSPSQLSSVVPLTTLWAWDTAGSKWYFYSPNLAAQGGTKLLDYIYANGYRDFTEYNITLGPGIGFWVNKP